MHLRYSTAPAAAVALLALVCASARAQDQLYLIRVDGKYGYMNRSGKVVIKPQYAMAYPFTAVYARVISAETQKVSFIDFTGNAPGGIEFDDATDFSDEFAWVRKGGRWGVINSGFAEIAEAEYLVPGTPFKDGRSAVMRDDISQVKSHGSQTIVTSHGIIDTQGRVVRELFLDYDIGPFGSGLAPFRRVWETTGDETKRANNKYGIMDKDGTIVVKATYDWIGSFRDGMAPVRMKSNYGYMNAQGRVVTGLKFYDACEFSDGFAAVRTQPFNGSDTISPNPYAKWGYINAKGSLTIQPKPRLSAGPFSEGFASVLEKRIVKVGELVDVVSVIDTKGRVQFTMEDVRIGPYKGGIAAVFAPKMDQAHPLRGYVDTKGEYVWRIAAAAKPKTSDDLFAFYDSHGNRGYIDRTGKVVVQPQYSSAGQFSCGLAPVSTGSGYGYIDRTGSMVIEPRFSEGSEFRDGVACAAMRYRAPAGKGRDVSIYGFIDTRGNWICPPRFFSPPQLAIQRGAAAASLDMQPTAEVPDKLALTDCQGELLAGPFIFERSCWLDHYCENLFVIYGGSGESWVYDSTGARLFSYAIQYKTSFESNPIGGGMVWCARKNTIFALEMTMKPAFGMKAAGCKKFGDGLAPVLVGKKWGYVNTKGQMAIPPRFVNAEPFSEGLAAVQMDGHPEYRDPPQAESTWVYIDKRARPAFEPRKMLLCGEFVDGVAPVLFKERNEVGLELQYAGLIDKKGTVLGKIANGEIRRFHNGVAVVRNRNAGTNPMGRDIHGLVGYIDRSGKVLWEKDF